MDAVATPQRDTEAAGRPELAGPHDDHLGNLKALTEKLRLETRRPSNLEWKAQLETQKAQDRLARDQGQTKSEEQRGASRRSRRSTMNSSFVREGQLPPASLKGFDNIDEALVWIRKELADMRAQDQQLARQLMRLRSDISKLKIEQTCHLHRRMLNDATLELEERDELSDLLCDFPVTPSLGLSAPLRLIGVTKMNINSRRFSLC